MNDGLVQVRHDDLREAAARFVDALAAGKEWLAECRDEQAAALAAEVAAMKGELLDMAAGLGGGVFVDPGAAAAEVVLQLDHAQERIAVLRVRCLLAVIECTTRQTRCNGYSWPATTPHCTLHFVLFYVAGAKSGRRMLS